MKKMEANYSVLCYVKGSTSSATFESVAMSLYHIKALILLHITNHASLHRSCSSCIHPFHQVLRHLLHSFHIGHIPNTSQGGRVRRGRVRSSHSEAYPLGRLSCRAYTRSHLQCTSLSTFLVCPSPFLEGSYSNSERNRICTCVRAHNVCL